MPHENLVLLMIKRNGPIARYALLVSAFLGATGVATAIFLDERQVGMIIFLCGFVLGSMSALVMLLLSNEGDLGKLQFDIKIAGCGFGLLLTGQLIVAFIKSGELIGNFLFVLGMLVMFIGIVLAAVRMTKP